MKKPPPSSKGRKGAKRKRSTNADGMSRPTTSTTAWQRFGSAAARVVARIWPEVAP